MKKFLSILLALSLCVTMAVSFAGCAKKAEDAFEKPETYASVIQVTINPTVNLYLDQNNLILAVEYVNTDAADIYQTIEDKLVGADLQTGVDLVIDTAADKGYLAENKEVSIDIIEAKDEIEQNAVLQVAITAAKTTLEEKVPEVTIKVLAKGEEISEDALQTEDVAATTASATETTATTGGTTGTTRLTQSQPKITAETTVKVTTKATTKVTTKATTKATTAANKNPQTDLKTGTEYAYYSLNSATGELLELTLSFDAAGVCSYAEILYGEEDFGQGSVEYNGKTYYEGGGRGGAVNYILTNEAITLTDMDDADNMVLTMNAKGELVVKSYTALFEGYNFKAGDIFVEK